jgi:glutathione S-transferase
MYKLYGFPISNYYNMVKLALLEKGIKFEEVTIRPTQDEDYLRKSPMGKVPCLEVPEGYLSETSVILDYLEDVSGDNKFYPRDSFQKAKVRQIMKSSELYVELVARRLLGGVFFGEALSDELKNEVRTQLHKGTTALNRLLKFGPYAAGNDMTYADIVLYYTVALGNMATKKALGVDLEDEMPGLTKWLELMDQSAHVQAVNADRNAALKAVAG